MFLSKYNLGYLSKDVVDVPDEKLFGLPEKVLQFGTGVLLRGLPDYFIDKANRKHVFNGRIVVVKSTDGGDAHAFEKQDSLYTICIRGIEDGKKIDKNIINSSISRVLSAKSDWDKVLECAHNPELTVVISNTTEVGIQLVNELITNTPPASFPGKLLAVLYERFKTFSGSEASGLVIVPTELITDNGKKLKDIILKLAAFNNLEAPFIKWLENSNRFCNTLVDRIVPGKPKPEPLEKLSVELGYSDDLLTMSEVYRLWAIEGDDKVKAVLSFAQVDDGVVITPDISLHKELKLRMLNGTHTLSCALAFLSGFKTVKNAMDDDKMVQFISDLMLKEIAPAIPYEIDAKAAEIFGSKVLDRFRNPHIEHFWISISMQYTSKLKMRVLPLIINYIRKFNKVPELMATGFAAYLLFLKPVKTEDGKYFGNWQGTEYPINDDEAAWFYEQWQGGETAAVVENILKNKDLWGTDLTLLPDFTANVAGKVKQFTEAGIEKAFA